MKNLVLKIVCICTACALGGCAVRDSRTNDSAVERVAITRGGKYIGNVERKVSASDNGRQIVTRQTFPVRIANSKPRTVIEEKIRVEDENRNTIRLTLVSKVDNSRVTTTAEIDELSAVVTRTSQSGIKKRSLQLPKGTYFDNGAQLFNLWNPQTHPELIFYTVDIRAPLLEKVVYTLQETNGKKTLLRRAYSKGTLRSVSRKFFDKKGVLTGSDQPMFGHDLISKPSNSRTPHDYELVDPVRSSSVKSPYRISREARNGHMRYTFGTEPGLSFLPPQTAEQKVEATANGFILDICERCGPGLNNSAGYLQDARAPTFWLDSDHATLQNVALKLANKNLTDLEKMNRLETWARRRMTDIDFAGHFSAAEALALRRGDCTEGAVVLAALGRAAGIPTKVASGIVYSREQYHGISHSFAPHAWTLAYVGGRWMSFDMSLEGFDSTHIALSVSDGDPGSIQSGHKLAALLEWEAMSQVKKK